MWWPFNAVRPIFWRDFSPRTTDLEGEYDLSGGTRVESRTGTYAKLMNGGRSAWADAQYLQVLYRYHDAWLDLIANWGDFTIQGWINQAYSGIMAIVRKRVSDYVLIIDNADRLDVETDQGTGNGNINLNQNQWYHICARSPFNSTTDVGTWIDGVAQSGTVDRGYNDDADQYIQGGTSVTAQKWRGNYCDFSFHKLALPEPVIQSFRHPATRYDLYYELGRRTYIPVGTAAAAPTGKFANRMTRGVHRGESRGVI